MTDPCVLYQRSECLCLGRWRLLVSVVWHEAGKTDQRAGICLRSIASTAATLNQTLPPPLFAAGFDFKHGTRARFNQFRNVSRHGGGLRKLGIVVL
jgi:hypothetical protein